MNVLLLLIPIISLLVGVGLAWVLGVAGVTSFHLLGLDEFLAALPRRIFSSLDVFALMAMPLFILLGEIMNRGGVTEALIKFSSLIVGRARGGLGHVNIATSLFFAGVSGSAMADAAAMSTVLVPSMKERGYTARYAGAITAASSMIGPIIPPSIILIFYGAVMGVDVAALFAAAIVPGFVLALGLFGLNAIYARLEDHPTEASRPPLVATVVEATPALLMPAVIMAGIVFGLVTPTEAGALAVLAALGAAALYKRLNWQSLKDSVMGATRLTGSIFSLFAAGAALNFLAALVGVPDLISSWVEGLGLGLNGYMLMLLVLFLLSGMVLETQIGLILIAPILVPTAHALGADPAHLGVIICLTLTLGLLSPPLGGAVLIVSSVTSESYWRLMRALTPFLLVEIGILIFLCFVPIVTLALPKWLGLI